MPSAILGDRLNDICVGGLSPFFGKRRFV